MFWNLQVSPGPLVLQVNPSQLSEDVSDRGLVEAVSIAAGESHFGHQPLICWEVFSKDLPLKA